MIMDPLLKVLFEQGTWAAIVGGMLWFMTKKLLNQYEARIDVLEDANQECKDDRKMLHEQVRDLTDKFHTKIEEMHLEHIDSLKRINKENSK